MKNKFMDTQNLIKLYIDEQRAITDLFPVKEAADLCDLVIKVYEEQGTIYICGNGGNAAFVDNFVTDLYFHPFVSDDKNTNPLPADVKKTWVVNLAVSPAILTGVMNDFGPDYIFSQQLEGHIGSKDLLIGLSGSGNSSNVIKAFEVAKKNRAKTVSITRGDGGKSKEITDLCIVIPGNSNFPGQVGKNNNNFHFEDYLSSISHMVTGILQQYVREKYGYKYK
jgi:D-sedoheptulose 7-phosphate isomerase